MGNSKPEIIMWARGKRTWEEMEDMGHERMENNKVNH